MIYEWIPLLWENNENWTKQIREKNKILNERYGVQPKQQHKLQLILM